jgi:hypothetical protein
LWWCSAVLCSAVLCSARRLRLLHPSITVVKPGSTHPPSPTTTTRPPALGPGRHAICSGRPHRTAAPGGTGTHPAKQRSRQGNMHGYSLRKTRNGAGRPRSHSASRPGVPCRQSVSRRTESRAATRTTQNRMLCALQLPHRPGFSRDAPCHSLAVVLNISITLAVYML